MGLAREAHPGDATRAFAAMAARRLETPRDIMSNFFADAVAPVHDRLDKIEARLNATTSAILQALHHIISNGKSAMDHDALLALAKELDSKADAAVSEFNTLQSDHGAKVQALDDIGSVLTSVGTKLDGIKAPAAVGGSAATGVTG